MALTSSLTFASEVKSVQCQDTDGCLVTCADSANTSGKIIRMLVKTMTPPYMYTGKTPKNENIFEKTIELAAKKFCK